MRTPKLYTSSVVILSLASLVENLAYALPISYFPNYVQLLGASIAYIGFFTAAFTAANATLSQRFGSLSDRIGRKPVIALGSLPSRLATLAFPFAPDLVSASGITVFRAFGHNVAMPATRALNADLIPENVRGKSSFSTILRSMFFPSSNSVTIHQNIGRAIDYRWLSLIVCGAPVKHVDLRDGSVLPQVFF